MTDYSNGQNTLLKRPEPGRPIHPISERKIISSSVDTNAIADAVIKAIIGKMPLVSNMQVTNSDDNFDNTASLQKLAEAMSITKDNEGKIEGIGVVKETKKDEEETKKTIDLLSQLGD